MTKKQTLSAILVFLLIIAASAIIANYTKTTIENTPRPVVLDDSNFLELLSPDRLEKAFLGIPWGGLSKDVGGLRPKGKIHSNDYLNYQDYIRPSDKLRFKGSIGTDILYSFNLNHGFMMATSRFFYPKINQEDFEHKILEIVRYLNKNYGQFALTHTEDDDEYIAYHIEWYNNATTITLSFSTPSDNIRKMGMYLIVIGSNIVTEKMVESQPKTLNFQ